MLCCVAPRACFWPRVSFAMVRWRVLCDGFDHNLNIIFVVFNQTESFIISPVQHCEVACWAVFSGLPCRWLCSRRAGSCSICSSCMNASSMWPFPHRRCSRSSGGRWRTNCHQELKGLPSFCSSAIQCSLISDKA